MIKKLFGFFMCFISVCSFTACDEMVSNTTTTLSYEVISMTNATILKKEDAQIVGLLSDGIRGMIVGEMTSETLNKINIKTNKFNAVLQIKETKIELDGFGHNYIEVENIPSGVWNVGDTVTIQIYLETYRNKYGNIYHKAWFAVDKRNYKNWRKNEKAIGLN